jgi:hypothetical protein
MQAMEAVAIPKRPRTIGGTMSYPRHVREADIAVLAENERLRREWDRLWLERQALSREIEKLREEKLDLQESALIWIGLYEKALDRELEARGRSASSESPAA